MNTTPSWNGTILIDAGPKILSPVSAKEVFVSNPVQNASAVRIPETILSKDGVIEFNKDSKGYLLLQEIRDESHRFAINAQRKKKNARNRKSHLDNIEGVGEVLKKRLLLNFKNIKNIKSANIEDLMTINGINAKIAKLIKEKL